MAKEINFICKFYYYKIKKYVQQPDSGLWKGLPDYIKLATSQESFHKVFGNRLFKLAYLQYLQIMKFVYLFKMCVKIYEPEHILERPRSFCVH